MNFSSQKHRALALLLVLCVVTSLPARASSTQDRRAQFPARTGYVNDFAAIIDGATKERVENILRNLRQRAGFEFVVVTVKSAGDQDIFDYSVQMADEWNIGSSASKQKSLLLVIAADSGKFFTQASKSVKGDLPDGLVGEMGRHMRLFFEAQQYSEGLATGIRTFANVLSERKGLSLVGIDQPSSEVAQATPGDKQPGGTEVKPPQLSETPTPAAVVMPQPSESPAATPVEAAAQLAGRPRIVATPTPSSSDDTGVQPAPTPEAAATTPQPSEATSAPPTNAPAKPAVGLVGADDAETLALILTLTPDKRIDALKSFIETHAQSSSRTHAMELVVVARATLGDQKLQAGDVAGGIEQFRLAVAETPPDMSDHLYADVVSRFPLNLVVRGQRAAAIESAHLIEALVGVNAKRLLALASFYLALEDVAEATRIAEFALKLAPDLAAAHQALGSARHLALQLDEAASEYGRALELDPKSAMARRSLADLKRAAGKSQEALGLYREQLQVDSKDKSARTGLILALFDLGKKDEAEAELASALKDDAQNVPLLMGVAYWYAAHGESARALDLAQQAVPIEPRYTWAQITLARSLVANKRPLEAERALRFARQYGRFPTLDYELATALASMGLYEEAAEELARSFTIKDGEIEARLAGRLPAHAGSFIDLLAPERRASIFQATAADSEANAKMLKSLMVFNAATDSPSGQNVNQAAIVAAAQEFAGAEDSMRTYRQIYVASRLLKKGMALPTVLEISEAAMRGVEAALDVPAATVAVQADDLRDIRFRAIAVGGTPSVPDAPRSALSALLRGRIEDLIGWALYNQDKSGEAVTHLRLAVGVLPEGTPLWRAALWHLGAALEADGKQDQALAYYIRSYVTGLPDPIHRVIIESLYRKVNGSLEGLDEKIGPSANVPSAAPGSTPSATPAPSPTP